ELVGLHPVGPAPLGRGEHRERREAVGEGVGQVDEARRGRGGGRGGGRARPTERQRAEPAGGHRRRGRRRAQEPPARQGRVVIVVRTGHAHGASPLIPQRAARPGDVPRLGPDWRSGEDEGTVDGWRLEKPGRSWRVAGRSSPAPFTPAARSGPRRCATWRSAGGSGSTRRTPTPISSPPWPAARSSSTAPASWLTPTGTGIVPSIARRASP